MTARGIGARLADEGVLWMEEPLDGTDLPGLASLRAAGLGVRIAGGEMTRTHHEAMWALASDAFDVYQEDVVLAGGMLRNRTLAEIGRQIGAGSRTLSRRLRAELGLTYHQWRTQIRLHHALILLAEDVAVTAVAHRCGWSSASTFIDVFRRVFGYTPGAGPGGPGAV